MRYLFYTNYRSGNAGLSNGIMSVEIGVILAHLTNRMLVLDGNRSPPANIVAYDGRVDNREGSRVTDLIDIPVPWAEPDAVELEGLDSLELTDRSLGELVFYFPKTRDVSSDDARSFARGREHWLTVNGEHERVPVLRLSEAPLVPGSREHRNNLGFYSYQFYLADETRASVFRLLQRMQAKPPFAELAARVARELGAFNAVHMRRGDFKVTYGVTTLERKPWEAIEAMDAVFSRSDPLVIVTDERDDPFFTEIRAAYPHHCFIDWHILDHYGADFAKLPRTDSLSLAYLSQLVAAESKEFIGTMTSTFTALIQRWRGNRGKREAFRFLWNELPEPGQPFERGRHAVNDCIPLERGEMVEQHEGPYSWNRVSQLLNPAWMREWPESFLTPEALATGALAARRESVSAGVPSRRTDAARQSAVMVGFESLQVAVRSADATLLQRLAPGLGARPGTPAVNVIANLDITRTGTSCRIDRRGRPDAVMCDEDRLADVLKREIVTIFAQARIRYAWLAAAAFARSGRGLVLAGEVGPAEDSLRRALETNGWDVLDGAAVAVRIEDLMIVPLGARNVPEGAAPPARRVPTTLCGLVVATRASLHARDAIAAASPAATVAALIGASLDIKVDRTRAIRHLCRIVEQQPVARLDWNHPQEAARLVTEWADTLPARSA
jgi:hypothetical protein